MISAMGMPVGVPAAGMVRRPVAANGVRFGKTINLPKTAQAQLKFLSTQLGQDPQVILNVASGLLPSARFFPNQDREFRLTMVNDEQVKALGATEAYPSKEEGADQYLTATVKPEDFKAWDATLNPLPIKRSTGVLGTLKNMLPKKPVEFQDNSHRDPAEAAYNIMYMMTIVWIPFGLAKIFQVKRHDKNRVLNGLNTLYEATQQKLKDPGRVLAKVELFPKSDTNELTVSIQKYNAIFKNMAGKQA